MSRYELMLVFRPDFDDKDEKKLAEAIKKLLGDAQVTLSQVTVLGKKQLAYPIKKYTEGIYSLAKIEGERLQVKDIETRAKLSGDVIRYLLTAVSS